MYISVYVYVCVCVHMYVGTINWLTKTRNEQYRPNDFTDFAVGTVSIRNSMQRSIFSDNM